MSSPGHGFSVLVAADSLKETASSVDVVAAIAAGVSRASPSASIDTAALGDGGEGTLEVLAGAFPDLEYRSVEGCGARPDLPGRTARWGLQSDRRRAVVELAEAAGLTTVPVDQRDPWRAGTASVGTVLEAARRFLDQDPGEPAELVLAVGGSATVDGGLGAARALGMVIEGPAGPRDRALTAGDLEMVRSVEIPDGLQDRWRGIRLRIAVDVRSPLLGADGAARVFGPQKGADEAMVQRLEQGLRHWSELVGRATGVAVDGPGVGAAGGIAVGLTPLTNASRTLSEQLEPGFDLVADALDLDDRLQRCDLVITSEGCLDRSSFEGKVVGRLVDRAEAHGIPAIAVPGRIGDPSDPQRARFHRIQSLSETVGIEEAMARPLEALAETTRRILLDEGWGCVADDEDGRP